MKTIGRILTVALLILYETPPAMADSLPAYMLGKWTTKKGDCKSLERLVFFRQNQVDRYESTCKIQKVANTQQNEGEHLYHGIDLICSDEGEKTEERLNIYHRSDNKKFEMYPTGGMVVIHKCGR